MGNVSKFFKTKKNPTKEAENEAAKVSTGTEKGGIKSFIKGIKDSGKLEKPLGEEESEPKKSGTKLSALSKLKLGTKKAIVEEPVESNGSGSKKVAHVDNSDMRALLEELLSEHRDKSQSLLEEQLVGQLTEAMEKKLVEALEATMEFFNQEMTGVRTEVRGVAAMVLELKNAVLEEEEEEEETKPSKTSKPKTPSKPDMETKPEKPPETKGSSDDLDEDTIVMALVETIRGEEHTKQREIFAKVSDLCGATADQAKAVLEKLMDNNIVIKQGRTYVVDAGDEEEQAAEPEGEEEAPDLDWEKVLDRTQRLLDATEDKAVPAKTWAANAASILGSEFPGLTADHIYEILTDILEAVDKRGNIVVDDSDE